ncbi:uncharacterized protein LOC110026633 [Phalaenopsis equestris]|uniref:uncharacterized protein LOC110026633 n=1 Tax=Phalaenopsis equestris TaxID=78828 RepID=UPI0009E3D4B6|nr:uncharacterized protein LOC110026633 [Phalaenopsis equestris]
MPYLRFTFYQPPCLSPRDFTTTFRPKSRLFHFSVPIVQELYLSPAQNFTYKATPPSTAAITTLPSMEVATPIPRSPDFHFTNTTFSLKHQYLYTSAPASPARASPIRSYPTPNSPHRNDASGDVFQFPFSPIRFHPPTVRRNSFHKKSSRQGRRKTRSLSPLRDEEHLTKPTSPSANPVKCGLSGKWPKLRDLLLFRSASEGRVTGRVSKDPLKNYTVLPSVSAVSCDGAGDDKKAGSRGGGGVVRRVRQPAVSAHEKLYKAKRAAAEEQKRKTPLPFQRHGLLGLVDFRPVIGGKSKVVGTSSVSTGRF